VNIQVESRRLENLAQTAGPEPLRVFIPRGLSFLYTLRNKRGFAHVGGDLDSERIDARTCVQVADWCLCELVRVVHRLSLEDAQALLDAVASREMPDVWSVVGKKRVLRKGLNYREQTLMLLYSAIDDAVLAEDLFVWTEYARLRDFRRSVLASLHRDRLVEWDRETESVLISPLGIKEVEDRILRMASDG
jgi:hypothetical protein